MLKAMILGMMVAVAASGARALQEEPPEDPAARVAVLIEQLGDPEFRAREAATEELKKIGQPATKALREALKSEDLEVRERARAILDHIGNSGGNKRLRESSPEELPFSFNFRSESHSESDGATVLILADAEGTAYTVTAKEGDKIVFRLFKDKRVQLTYPGEGEEEKTATAETLEAFLDEHAALAEKYAITKEGIGHGGAAVRFSDQPGGLRVILRDGRDRFENMDRRLEEMLERLQREFGNTDKMMEELEEMDRRMERTLEKLRREFGDPDRWHLDLEEKMRELMGDRRTSAGVRLGGVDAVLRMHLGIPEGEGMVVHEVARDSTPGRLGLRRFDVLLKVDGAAVTDALAAERITEDSRLTVIREGVRTQLPEPPEK